MFNIGAYTTDVWAVLTMGSKYFLLLALCVLAIRLWRQYLKVPAARRLGGLLLALAVTALAAVTGYVSMRQSLSSMDSYYGMQALTGGRVPQALTLFEAADRNWQSPDTIGQRGVCLVLLGDADRGLKLVGQAQAMRHGAGRPAEFFYEGAYWFSRGENDRAWPLLEAVTDQPLYCWPATKILAVVELDESKVAAAAARMAVFMQANVTDFEQAYIVASLEFAAGQKAEARTLLAKFPTATLSPRWQKRFQTLQAKLND